MMARKSKIDEDCEELGVVEFPKTFKLKTAKLKSVPFLYWPRRSCGVQEEVEEVISIQLSDTEAESEMAPFFCVHIL